MREKHDQELVKLVLRNQYARVAGKSLHEIANSAQTDLELTPMAYNRLMAGIELGKRVASQSAEKRTKIRSSAEALEFCSLHFARLISEGLQEEFHIVTLTTKNQIIASHQISVGTLDAALVHPREIFRPAIRDASSSIILAHNHPSGDPTPSREDYAVTNRLTEAGKLIGIDVLDHIVMGQDGCMSVRELE